MALGYLGQQLENSFAYGFLQGLLGGQESQVLGDWWHASQIFRTGSYANAPKLKFLFHVHFDINPSVYFVPPSTNNLFGVLVNQIQLPSYKFDTHVLNQYNRKRIVQTKIRYNPVQIVFHDDSSNNIAKMWAAYYTYYYNDGSIPGVQFSGSPGTASNGYFSPPNGGQGQFITNANYQLKTQYVPGDQLPQPNNWGYIGDTNNPTTQAVLKQPFFNNITVFGINRHNFLSYTLINPIITNYSHDTYNYDEGNGTMKNNMTIDYETVVYNEGSIDGANPSAIATGFGDPSTYDRRLSPITPDGTQSLVIGPNGMGQGPVGGSVTPLQRQSTIQPNPPAGPTTTQYSSNVNQQTLNQLLANSNASTLLGNNSSGTLLPGSTTTLLPPTLQNINNTAPAVINTTGTISLFPTAGQSPGIAGTAAVPDLISAGSQTPYPVSFVASPVLLGGVTPTSTVPTNIQANYTINAVQSAPAAGTQATGP